MISFSPNDDKVLYQAISDSKIPDQILTPPPAQNTQSQARSIIKDNYYVYDIKDDTNFLIGSPLSINFPFWLLSSNNLVFTENQTIKAVDYDATNQVTLFNLNTLPAVVFPWSDGNHIIILTAPYTGAQPNLYSVTVR
jgi:hypothetical protein